MMTLLVFLFTLAASVYLEQRLRRVERSYTAGREHKALMDRVVDLEMSPTASTMSDHRELELRVVELETWKNGRKRRPRTIIPPPNGRASEPPTIPPAPATPRGVL